MSLNKQLVDVIFRNGINTKLDSKTNLSADLIKLENRVFSKIGAVHKKYGNAVVGSKDSSTEANINNFNAITTYNNDNLILMANNNLFGYAQANDNWIQKDTFTSASVTLDSAVNNTAEQTTPQICVLNNVVAYVWTDSSGGLRYSVQDENSKTFYINDEVLDASGDTPNCIGLGANILFTYASGSDLKFKSIGTGNPAAGFVTTGTIRADLHADHIYDLTQIGNKGYVIYKDTSTYVKLTEFDHNGGTTNINSTTEVVVDTLAVHTYVDTETTTNNFTVLWKKDANTVRVGQWSTGLVVSNAAQDVDTTASTDISKVAIARTTATTDSVELFWQVPAVNTFDHYIKTRSLDLDGNLGTAGTFLKSVGIATKGFNGIDGALFLNVIHESDLQATVFTVNSDANVVCKFAAGNSGTHTAIGAFPPKVVQLDNNDYMFPMCTKGTIRSENATLFSLLGVSLAQIDFTSQNTYSNVNINENLFVVGGILHLYDGHNMTEQGFNVYPEEVIDDSTATTGGNISDGTYLYRAVYRWTDNNGNIHTSAPSTPLSVTLTGGTATQTQTITVPTLRITKKRDDRRNVTIELFRTEGSGSAFYKVTSLSSPVDNDTTVDTVDVVDTLADASIVSNEILYTGVIGPNAILDNISAPSCDIVTTHASRLFVAGLTNKNEIRYSKIVRLGTGIAFNELLSITVDPKGGPITNLASLDANLIVFKRDNIYSISGDGPSDTGAGATFSEPELIASDVGCIDVNSIILGPDGLYFKSAKGIYLIDRSQSVTYIGSPVEDYNSNTITSAQLLDDVNEIRFTTLSGTTLVYNYFFKQWSTFNNQQLIDSTIWNNSFVSIDQRNLISIEDNTTYRDRGAFVSSIVSTGWIKLNTMQGYQRAYRLKVLGEWKSNHKMKVTIYNDYSKVPQQVKIINVTDFISSDDDFYGDGTYGSGTYGGDSNGVYEFEIHIKKQKCQAIRVEIEDIFSNSELGSNNGNGMELTGVTMQLGLKRGLRKVGTSKKG